MRYASSEAIFEQENRLYSSRTAKNENGSEHSGLSFRVEGKQVESTARAHIKLASSKEPLEGLITYADKDRICVQLEQPHNAELRLRFKGKPQLIQQRKYNRYDCELKVKVRKATTDLMNEGWSEATALDISQGGMRLAVDPGIRVPDHLEVVFWLLGAGTVTTFAQVRGRRKEADGKQSIRIAFEELEPKHQALLSQIFP